jgi:hypothetical protein
MRLLSQKLEGLTVERLHSLADQIGETWYDTREQAAKAGECLVKIDLALYNHPDATMEDSLDWETLMFGSGDFIEVDYPEYGE